ILRRIASLRHGFEIAVIFPAQRPSCSLAPEVFMLAPIRVAFIFLLALFSSSASHSQTKSPVTSSTDDWAYYGHDAGGMRYSPLTQINRENVSKLKVAWVFHTSDVSDGSNDIKRSGLETTPILVDSTLFLTTAFNRVIALDPETGKQKWAYDPMIDIAG